MYVSQRLTLGAPIVLTFVSGGGMINNTFGPAQKKKKVLIAAAYSKSSPPYPYIEGGLGRAEKRANQG